MNQFIKVEKKLKACRSARKWAADSFHYGLRSLLNLGEPISEVILRDKWLRELRKNKDLFADGWYMPPPHGIGILFGTEENYDRMNYESLRQSEMYPRKDLFLNRKTGIIYVYASPVDRKTGMIGDWGMTIYFGNNQDIIEHLRICLLLNHQVLDHVQAGMTFADLTIFANNVFHQLSLSNEITSTTDSASVNIGHTVPGSYENWSKKEQKILKGDNWQQTLTMISKKRKFLNTIEQLKIQPGMAFTIEQRLTKPGYPKISMSSFHTIAIIHQDGTKELLTDFKEIFRLVGMDYMLTKS